MFFRGWMRPLRSNEVPFKGAKVYSSVELKSHSYYSSCCCVSVGWGSNPLSAGFVVFPCLTADKCSLYGQITISCRLLESICFLRFAPFMLQECRQTAATGAYQTIKKPTHPWWFWYSGVFLLHQTPLSLYLFLQTGSSGGLAEKERRGARWKKQNKFSDMPPEAERLCRRTDSPSSSCRTEEKIFKRRQKQRASPLTGKRAGGDAVSHNVKRSGSSVHVYIYTQLLGQLTTLQHESVCVCVCMGHNLL